ncbi:hypothetical protein [Polaromonas sp.]|uniref:hypothetical protein n=1 Tax=Polaromonas sp. TaxID=1869339 RepID=UPI0017D98E8F|nr:hypothetical protein [Polaromonas sp.]NMM04665.1 hypothetical protein [Polaromonas sp.]
MGFTVIEPAFELTGLDLEALALGRLLEQEANHQVGIGDAVGLGVVREQTATALGINLLAEIFCFFGANRKSSVACDNPSAGFERKTRLPPAWH